MFAIGSPVESMHNPRLEAGSSTNERASRDVTLFAGNLIHDDVLPAYRD